MIIGLSRRDNPIINKIFFDNPKSCPKKARFGSIERVKTIFLERIANSELQLQIFQSGVWQHEFIS